MKLLYCPACLDVVSLLMHQDRYCRCGAVHGQYADERHAVYWGKIGVPLGFANPSFRQAIIRRPTGPGHGTRFDAFVVPQLSATFVYREEKE